MADNDRVAKKTPLFQSIDADNDHEETVSEIESLCMACHENGTTRMMLTKIPMFREIIIMSFSCPHCHMQNNEVQFGGRFADTGCRYRFAVKEENDLNRQIVKSDWCTVQIPQLDFEIPARTQSAALTTVEGLLRRAEHGLELYQPARKVTDPEAAAKIDEFIKRLRKCYNGDEEFTLILDDPTGNSFVENPSFPDKDANLDAEYYKRTRKHNILLGVQDENSSADEVCPDGEAGDEGTLDVDVPEEVMVFDSNCSACLTPTQTRMKSVAIPHFKEVIVMATTCDACGYRTNEVKSGGGISEKGVRLKLSIASLQDLTRDVLKAETCIVQIPELEFEWHSGISSGRFTTVEGLLMNIKDNLERMNPLSVGDSVLTSNTTKDIISSITKITLGELIATLILDDPAGNSFIQSDCLPDPDPILSVEYYERTDEQNELLGLKDMRVENYCSKA